MATASRTPGSEEVSNSVLQRVGLSVLASNTDFEQQARREASDAENNLLEIQRRAGLQAARCRQHLESLEKEVRAEEEKRLISDRIGHELEVMKQEMRQREVREEEHLREVYRAILQPQPARLTEPAYSAPHLLDTWQLQGSALDTFQFQADVAARYPPIIASAVHLTSSPIHLENPKLEVQTRQPPSADVFGLLALDSSLTVESDSMSRKGRARSSSQRRMPGAASAHSGAGRRRSSRGAAAVPSLEPSSAGAAGTSEAQALLRLNLSRLQKLEQLGL